MITLIWRRFAEHRSTVLSRRSRQQILLSCRIPLSRIAEDCNHFRKQWCIIYMILLESSNTIHKTCNIQETYAMHDHLQINLCTFTSKPVFFHKSLSHTFVTLIGHTTSQSPPRNHPKICRETSSASNFWPMAPVPCGVMSHLKGTDGVCVFFFRWKWQVAYWKNPPWMVPYPLYKEPITGYFEEYFVFWRKCLFDW